MNKFDIAKIDSCFPFGTYRKGQKEAIEFIINSINKGKKFIVLEAPTGSGKSPIGIAMGNMADSTYYITIQKILQDQLCADFGEAGKHGHYTIPLKGRNAYTCTWRKRKVAALESGKAITQKTAFEWRTKHYTCDQGHCKEHGESSYQECKDAGQCPYYKQVNKAVHAKTTTMNFSSFLYQTSFSTRFAEREMMIIDEAHNCESQLMGFISLTISDRDVPNLKFPKYDTPEEYAAWMLEENLVIRIESEIIIAQKNNDVKRTDDLKRLRHKYTFFMESMTGDNIDPWVSEYSFTKGVRRVEFKPIYISKYAHKHLFDMADIVVMMSATILDVNVLSRSLGIPKNQIAAKRMPSHFPVENHPIYYKPVVKVTGGNKQVGRWGPPLITEVNRIASKYVGKKGIVHTHNFAISQLLVDGCTAPVQRRLLFQKNFKTKDAMLAKHESSKDSIIVAPAMHEGLDLKDDLSRFQVICKIPFPNFYEDKQLAARMESDDAFYNWLVALKLCQSTGRSVRSETDYADTYIIDESFNWWYQQNKKMLPSWFKNSVQYLK